MTILSRPWFELTGYTISQEAIPYGITALQSPKIRGRLCVYEFVLSHWHALHQLPDQPHFLPMYKIVYGDSIFIPKTPGVSTGRGKNATITTGWGPLETLERPRTRNPAPLCIVGL